MRYAPLVLILAGCTVGPPPDPPVTVPVDFRFGVLSERPHDGCVKQRLPWPAPEYVWDCRDD